MSLHQIFLQPTDVLFFRDGRPMSGSLAGHSAAWPLPDVTNHALHAALHRADLESATGQKLHTHRRGCSGNYSDDQTHRDKRFGSLSTAGPFPVFFESAPVFSGAPGPTPLWFFPRPKDAQLSSSVRVTHRPFNPRNQNGKDDLWLGSSLPEVLEYAVANTQPPDKEAGGEPWISSDAFNAYLRGEEVKPKPEDQRPHFLRDADLADTEQAIGIGIDPERQTQDGKNFYSAHYLRLREAFRLGLFAIAMDKLNGDSSGKRDLIKLLLNDRPQSIIVGGQQRICSAERKDVPAAGLPLPLGLHANFHSRGEGASKRWLIKWVLLTPAIWPEIPARKKDGTRQNPHPGGWLPNWVFVNWDAETRQSRSDHRNGEVLLTTGPGIQKAARKGLSSGARLSARLVAAIIPKPIPVTGWALPNDTDRVEGGAKSTHLAVPAGAVYYFEAESEKDATALANALNWHGKGIGGTPKDYISIMNRRSTLLGEKGYGLGVCGTWDFYGSAPNA